MYFFFIGILSAYALLPTTGQTAYQQRLGNIPEDLSLYDALIAVDHCGLIGSEAILYTDEGEFSAIVYDCAGSYGAQFFSDGNDPATPYLLAGEVDYDFWLDHPELVGSLVRIEVALDLERREPDMFQQKAWEVTTEMQVTGQGGLRLNAAAGIQQQVNVDNEFGLDLQIVTDEVVVDGRTVQAAESLTGKVPRRVYVWKAGEPIYWFEETQDELVIPLFKYPFKNDSVAGVKELEFGNII